MSATYHVGYSTAKDLHRLAESEQEHGAIRRLEDFRGDERDVRTAAELYKRAGEGANASALMALLAGEGMMEDGE